MWALWAGIRERGLQVLVFPDGLTYTARGATEVGALEHATSTGAISASSTIPTSKRGESGVMMQSFCENNGERQRRAARSAAQ